MKLGSTLLALSIFLGSTGSAAIMAKSFSNVKMLDRTVQVKGLAEKKVKADSSVWVIPINTANENLISAQSKINDDINKIKSFLKKYNLSEDEMTIQSIRVSDKLAQRYYDQNNKAPRYFMESEVVVKSKKIDEVIKASQNIGEIIAQNITVAYDEYKYNGPKFFFTKLNEIKPGMLADATKEARKAAEEFAVNSGSRIGKIKRASQGVFSISARETIIAQDNMSYGTNDAYFADKLVRVLTSVEYYLED